MTLPTLRLSAFRYNPELNIFHSFFLRSLLGFNIFFFLSRETNDNDSLLSGARFSSLSSLEISYTALRELFSYFIFLSFPILQAITRMLRSKDSVL